MAKLPTVRSGEDYYYCPNCDTKSEDSVCNECGYEDCVQYCGGCGEALDNCECGE